MKPSVVRAAPAPPEKDAFAKDAQQCHPVHPFVPFARSGLVYHEPGLVVGWAEPKSRERPHAPHGWVDGWDGGPRKSAAASLGSAMDPAPTSLPSSSVRPLRSLPSCLSAAWQGKAASALAFFCQCQWMGRPSARLEVPHGCQSGSPPLMLGWAGAAV
ncbi:hypothetical protein BC567DRAFT_82936 [Phyllosticta citribraziliensis]